MIARPPLRTPPPDQPKLPVHPLLCCQSTAAFSLSHSAATAIPTLAPAYLCSRQSWRTHTTASQTEFDRGKHCHRNFSIDRDTPAAPLIGCFPSQAEVTPKRSYTHLEPNQKTLTIPSILRDRSCREAVLLMWTPGLQEQFNVVTFAYEYKLSTVR